MVFLFSSRTLQFLFLFLLSPIWGRNCSRTTDSPVFLGSVLAVPDAHLMSFIQHIRYKLQGLGHYLIPQVYNFHHRPIGTAPCWRKSYSFSNFVSFPNLVTVVQIVTCKWKYCSTILMWWNILNILTSYLAVCKIIGTFFYYHCYNCYAIYIE